jgi:hypothetical protein
MLGCAFTKITPFRFETSKRIGFIDNLKRDPAFAGNVRIQISSSRFQ